MQNLITFKSTYTTSLCNKYSSDKLAENDNFEIGA